MNEDRELIWSIESSEKVEEIINHLLLHWSNNEAEKFLERLKNFELFVKKYPFL